MDLDVLGRQVRELMEWRKEIDAKLNTQLEVVKSPVPVVAAETPAKPEPAEG